ncbi:thiamine pyrophosphate-binding protein [Halorubrum sp. DTA98]|uniref:thiamine pyrophosphate-binding protein n=1 Tax=Halorubrum sp. DTA98 TaxID=3402163 RepID=UPI003AACB8F9
MKGHDAIVRLLDAAGVDTVFTLMSEDTMAMMAELETEWSDDVRMVKARHEQGAVAMADGYARATDRVGVCLVGRGPAVSQTGNALVTARKKGSDLLLVVPEPPLSASYDVKAFEQEAYLRSTVGTVTSARSPETLVETVSDAYRRVAAGDGPIAVQVPWDVMDGDLDGFDGGLDAKGGIEGGVNGRDTPTVDDARVHPDEELVRRAIDMYVDSDAFRPPVVLAGYGAVEAGAREAIETFAERINAVLATSLQARDYFVDHPYHVGFTGSWGSPLANEYANEAHVVFAVGASLNPYTVDEGHVFGEETRVVHVDRDPTAIGRYTDVALGIAGDARVTVEALLAEVERRGIDRGEALWTEDRRTRIAEASPMNDREFPTVPGTVDPRALVTELNRILPDERKLVLDGGHFTRWCMDGIRTPPEDLTFTLDFAGIGLGLPMGVGTAVAASEKTCVTVCGDAGFMMSLQELETAVRADVPMTLIVMNDGSLGSEYHSLDVQGEPPGVALISSPEIADVAESLGAEGFTVRSIDDLTALADELGAEPDGPIVVDCKVNHEVRHRSKT